MFSKFSQRSRYGGPYSELSFRGPNKEKEINEKLSRIEEAYVDAAIRKSEANQAGIRQQRPHGLTN